VVRDTLGRALDLDFGVGVLAEDDEASMRRSRLDLRWSLVEDNRMVGVLVAGSDATIEGCAIRGTLPRESDSSFGRGLSIQDGGGAGQRAAATIRSSLVADNHEIGVLVSGADAVIEGTVVRDTQCDDADDFEGRGINVQRSLGSGEGATAAIRYSLVERNREAGVYVNGASVRIEATVIRDTAAAEAGPFFGDGISVVLGDPGSFADVLGSLVASNARAGVCTFGAAVTLGTTAFECNAIDLAGETFGTVSFGLGDLGGNTCGCDSDDRVCRVLTANLEAPGPAGSN